MKAGGRGSADKQKGTSMYADDKYKIVGTISIPEEKREEFNRNVEKVLDVFGIRQTVRRAPLNQTAAAGHRVSREISIETAVLTRPGRHRQGRKLPTVFDPTWRRHIVRTMRSMLRKRAKPLCR